MKVLRPGLLTACAAFFFLSLSPPAAAQATFYRESVTVPFNYTVPNSCTGDDLLVVGRTAYDLFEVVNPRGGYTITETYSTSGTAVGVDSGTEYTLLSSNHVASSKPQGGVQGGAQIFTAAFHMYFISPGAGTNVLVQGVFHYTVNAQGEFVASVDNATTQCVG